MISLNSFYLKQLLSKNVGPLSNVHIDFPFFENGDPKPIILVGENGTGKSTILSNIVDAFFEMAGRTFTNANQGSENSGYQYFKTISPIEIHSGASYMYSYISFAAQNNPKYLFKAGNITVDEVQEQIGDNLINASWESDENVKSVTADKKTISNIWENNVICYFGPDRYEKPAWMGDKYFRTEEALHPTIQKNYNGILNNPIIVQDVTNSNLQWLLDVIADSRVDIEGSISSMKLADYVKAMDVFLLKQARNNLETILSSILGEDVYFQLNFRNSGGSRFKIVNRGNGKIICPTLGKH